MNKTVNINLGGRFFYIDRDAYNKLRHYLNTIGASLTDTASRDEILADIESRISELFVEKIKTERQVISIDDVDQIILIMGQPEDYFTDEQTFKDSDREKGEKSSSKKLYRDPDNQYIGGVSSGLGHFFGVDALGIRVLWLLLFFFTATSVVLVYILLWILIPKANTTTQKLQMRGKPVNISNIEKKIKEKLEDATNTIKETDYNKVGQKLKSKAQLFFEAIGSVILFLFKIFVKLIGVLLLIISSIAIIALFVTLFLSAIVGLVEFPIITDLDGLFYQPYFPVWLMSLLLFFVITIPFLFLFILGMHILVENTKTISRSIKNGLLILWLASIIGWVAIGLGWGIFLS